MLTRLQSLLLSPGIRTFNGRLWRQHIRSTNTIRSDDDIGEEAAGEGVAICGLDAWRYRGKDDARGFWTGTCVEAAGGYSLGTG